MSNRKIFVLGANSFSGQDFVDLLLDNPGNSVTGVSRSEERSSLFLKYRLRDELSSYHYLQMDMNLDMPRLLEQLDEERPSWIVNYAAQSEVGPSWENPEHWFQTNTVAFAKLVNHLSRRDYVERFVQISSAEAYGSCTGVVTEDQPDNPSTPYAASRSATDMLFAAYHRQFGFPILTVRPTNVFGARQQLFKIIPRTAIYLRQNRKIQLHGGGMAVKSFVHIRDVSRGVLSILEAGSIGEKYHLSPSSGISVRAAVEMICNMSNRDFADAVEIVDDRPGQDARYVIDSTKAFKAFGWRPEILMETGIEEVLSWVNDNWQEIAQQSSDYNHKP
jgi:dTDP-glucose 4,6-dehydratase